MSKKPPTKEILSEDSSESSVSVRRSSRISSNQNVVGSPIVKTVTTRRSSASSIAGKDTNADSDRNSPVVEKRKTRRTSTDSDINPTPIKTRRSSVSKIIEEEKKTTSSPSTPSKKNIRSMSRSPSNLADVPARRTRRSSQDTEPVVEQPARRSTRRRPSADTQEESTKDETIELAKPVTRRRRSSSADESEVIKIDTKPKTKRLFSEDNQLEPIHEREAEPKDDHPKVSESQNKTVHELSIIEEIEDQDAEESEKIIKDIDDVLANKDSSPKPKSAVPEKVSSKSIFSPLTPKLKQGKTTEEQKENVQVPHKDSPIKEKDVKEIPEKEDIIKDEASKKRQSLKKTDEDILHDDSFETASNKSTTTASRKSTEPKQLISEGSDDSFTLRLQLDKSLSKADQSQDDEVFSSPGSNKENSSINIPQKNVPAKQRDSINKSKTSNASPNTKRTSFFEAMEVDDDNEFSKVEENSKQDCTSEEPKSQENIESEEEQIVVLDSESNSPEPKEAEDHVNKSFARINSSQSDNLNSSTNTIDSPKKSTLTDKNISVSNKRDGDDSSSDLSIKLVDSDEDISIVEEKVQAPPKVENVKRSKRPRISDGTSKTILQRLQQDVEEAPKSQNQEIVSKDNPTLQKLPEEDMVERKSLDESINVNKQSKEPESSDPTTEEESLSFSPKTEKSPNKSNTKANLSIVSSEEDKEIDEVVRNDEKSKRKSLKSQNKEANKSSSSKHDSILNKSSGEKKETFKEANKSSSSKHDSILNKSSGEKKKTEQQSKDQAEAISPLKSKMSKMQNCGVNFSNPSPLITKIELDAETMSKLDGFLTKKLNAIADDDTTSSEESRVKKQSTTASSDESEDFAKNEFIDDMAVEFEEDTPSDGSNDIVDEGESINSSACESDSDDSYDLDDSFIADSSEQELLTGNEYDLDMDEDELNSKKLKRKRLVRKENSTSEDEVEEEKAPKRTYNKDFKANKTETPKGKSPRTSRTINSPRYIEKTDFERSITGKSSTPVIKTTIPTIRVDAAREDVEDTSVFEEKIRSLVEPKNNTPNSSFSEAGNTSKTNKSARSSSIIIQENISISEMQSDLIADKLQQVVKVFCAGIRSSDGNVSMNVSLDFTENTPNAPDVPENNDVINVDDTDDEKDKPTNISQKSLGNLSQMDNSQRIKESPAMKKRRSSRKFDQSEEIKGATFQDEEMEVSKAIPNRRSSHKFDKSVDQSKQIYPSTSQDKELEVCVSKKKRRSSHKFDKSTDQSKVIDPSNSQEEELELSQIIAKEHDLSEEVSKSRRKRRSSHKLDKQLNQSTEIEPTNVTDKELETSGNIHDLAIALSKSQKKRRSSHKLDKSSGEFKELNASKNNVEDAKVSDNELTKKQKRRSSNKFEQLNISGIKDHPSSPSPEEKKANVSEVEKLELQTSSRNIDTNEEKEKTTTESDIEDKQTSNKKKRNRKRKPKTTIDDAEPKQQITTSKRLKLVEMDCQELAPNDLRHKLPSRNEYSKSTDRKSDKNRLKKLQSNMNLNMNYARLGELITDVKNRPKRSIKPSSDADNTGWIVEADNVKPSVSNDTAFNYKKINEKDFKNQMLYDPRIRREPTAKSLRNKGYYL